MEQNIFLQEYFKVILIFIPAKKRIKYFNDTIQINSWKSNGLSEEDTKNMTKQDSLFAPTFVDHYKNLLINLNFNGHCLINNDIPIPKKLINYIFLTS